MVVKCSVSMEESVHRKPHHHLHKNYDLTYSDVEAAAAAQQLMQLSDEENTNANTNSARNYNAYNDEVDQRLPLKDHNNNNNNNKIMEEIFGKEEVLVFPAAKKRRYRSLADIYMHTKILIG